jgi:hypothetical protein
MADMKAVTPLSGKLETSAGASASGEDRSKWSFEDYQQKNPEAFMQLAEKDPATAEALTEAHYKEN